MTSLRTHRLSLFLAALGLSFALAACSGDDSGETESETGTTAGTAGTTPGGTAGTTTRGTSAGETETGGTTGGAEASFADIQEILTASCVAGCHSATGVQAALSFEEGMSYANMVGKQSTQVASMNIVEAGDTEKSYLWHKINGTHLSVPGGFGGMMPAAKLPADQIAAFESWITAGAKM